MRTLNVKAITKKELQKKWGIPLPAKYDKNLFIRCNAKGDVNWEKAPVYEFHELKERGNYKIWH